ncbi:serine/threonine-protein kinase [Microbispora sp. H10949]|uniref:serine/threonine-protein kinase n=1 Tax=Microbispora sp. H10949 TaxID=2729111 RepID=UPI001603EB16|nr:serine/threonine-protein kinase [Microbispora sp. H10949]
MTDLTRARLIADRYRLHQPIGQGGMGEVWAAYDPVLDRRVAVKLMKEPHVLSGDRETARKRFLREVKTAASLSCVGIPAVHDAGEDRDSGQLYVVMELLTGAEVHDLIGEQDYGDDPPSIAWAAAIAAQVAATLAEVHQVSVVHRDIKPRNLYVTNGGVVKVLDFGIAALLDGGDGARLTMVGQTIGTPPYMSPEQCLSSGLGSATDVYALGCVLHELLTGELVFEPDASIRYNHVHTQPPAVTTLRADVPSPIETLILRMLAKNSDDRPDAESVYDALLPYVRADGAQAVRPEFDPTRPFTKPLAAVPRRRPEPLPVSHKPLPVEEADEIRERAARLAKAEQFAEATDLLAEAIARAGHDRGLAADLRLGLAGVLFAAGSYRRALGEFEAAGAALTALYGDGDMDVLECRYYAANCRSLLGEDTAALAAFQDLLPEWLLVVDEHDPRTEEIHLQVGVLLARTRRFLEARAAFEEIRDERAERFGDHSPEVVEIDGYIARLDQYDE